MKLQENPRRPPKQWMRDCVRGASESSRDPGAVCGALWYHKMSASQKRAALAREGKLQENAPTNWVPWALGAVALGAWWLFAGSSKAGAASNATCPVDKQKFNAWLIEKGLAGQCAPNETNPPYTYADLQKAGLAPATFNAYVLVLGDGSFWYYANPSAPAVKSDNLKNQYAAYASGAVHGHPANFFIV